MQNISKKLLKRRKDWKLRSRNLKIRANQARRSPKFRQRSPQQVPPIKVAKISHLTTREAKGLVNLRSLRKQPLRGNLEGFRFKKLA